MADLDIRIAGSGGQGVILCSIILADAALAMGKSAAQSQSYGPEARGGTCKAEVVISDDQIGFPKVEDSDFLLALTQDALNKYVKQAKPGSVVMYDDSLDAPDISDCAECRLVSVPILAIARDNVKKMMVANIVAVGVINSFLKIADFDTLEKVTLKNVPKGTEDINRFALFEGAKVTF